MKEASHYPNPQLKREKDFLPLQSGGILYTEDHIPINTVYASFKSHPEEVTEQSVRQIFDKYGPIKNVRIHTNQNACGHYDSDQEEGAVGGSSYRRRYKKYNQWEPRVIRYAFVSFENCKDAAKCIQMMPKSKQKCYVAPADSWHQDEYHKQQAAMKVGDEPSGPNGADSGNSKTDLTQAEASSSETALNNPEKTEMKEGTSHTASADSEAHSPMGTNILQLNDDCLMLIFQQLDLAQLITLKNTCTRFEMIARDMFKRFKSINFSSHIYSKAYITMLDAKNILTEVGPYVENLNIAREDFLRPGVRTLTLIPRYCTSLKTLCIKDFTLNPKTLKSLASVFGALQELSLIACGVSDNIERHLAQAKNLQRLDLSSNSEITGKCLKAVRNLKYLNLENCQNIQGKPFSAFAEGNKTIEFLNIHCCSRLTSEAIRSIVTNMTELSHLVCNNKYDNADPSCVATIASLPKLKKVQLKITSLSSIEQIIHSLVETNQLEHLDLSDGIYTSVDYSRLSRLTNLRELKLNYKLDFADEHLAQFCSNGNFVELHIAGCTKVSDKQLIEFIKANPCLRVLDISFCEISEGLIFSTLDILKEQAASSRGPNRKLKMVVGQTSICSVILHNGLIKNHAHLLQISFDYTDSYYSAMGLEDLYDDLLDDDDEVFMGYDYEDEDSDSCFWDNELDPYEMCLYDSDMDEYQYINMNMMYM